MQVWLKVKLGKVEVVAQINMNSLPKVKLAQVGVGSNIAQNNSNMKIRSLLFSEIWFYLPLFGPKLPCLSIFSLTYLHLPLFNYIWPYLPIGDHYLLDSSIPPRNNQDQVTNDRGLSLIDMCISVQLRILNGDFTCHKHNGNSSIDYCIVSEHLFNEINLFEVGNHLSDLSDHSQISCHIKRIKYKTEQLHCDNLKLETIPLGYM